MVTLVQGRTVRYSNVPPRSAIATKTYDLEVPGSAPIRIIEAEPIWTTEHTPYSTYGYRDDFEHRSTRPKAPKNYDYYTTQPTRTTITEPVTHEPEHSTAYSADSLNNFLKEYAQRVNADRKKFTVDDEEEEQTEGSTEEPVNKLASLYLENERNANEDDKSKSWGLVDTQHHKHPFEDKKGWVSLEAIPWSSSKISKWQSNNKNEPKPWENNRPPQSPTWNTKPITNTFKNPYLQDTNNNNYNTNNYNPYGGQNINDKNYFLTNNNNNNEDQYNPNDSIFVDKPVASYEADLHAANDFPSRPNFQERPQFNRPTYSFDLKPVKIKPESSWPEEIPSKPAYTIRPSQPQHQNQWNNKPVPDPWLDRNPSSQFMFGYKDDNRDIITDGRPGEFPPTQSTNYNQQEYSNYEPLPTIQDRPSNVNEHHPSHPAHGNGEWVLVSTTRGYQYPKTKHQRSIDVTPNSIGTRRGIRLTVLPPDSDANINMTTSHGGLLEVESTFETVEESQNKFVEIQQDFNKTKPEAHTNNHRRKKPVRTQVLITPRPLISKPIVTTRPLAPIRPVATQRPIANRRPLMKPVTVVNNNNPDASAVLAAVGAGMVPATMAMLVPFVTGRRKRSVETNLEKALNYTQWPEIRNYRF